MSHPDGRVLAVQQHLFFTKILAAEMEIEHQILLDALSNAGMGLTPDIGEISVDAAIIMRNPLRNEEQKLRAVPDMDGK